MYLLYTVYTTMSRGKWQIWHQFSDSQKTRISRLHERQRARFCWGIASGGVEHTPPALPTGAFRKLRWHRAIPGS